MYKYCPPFPSAVFGGSLQVAYKEKSQGATWAGFFFIGGLREYYSIAAAVRHGRLMRC